MAKQNTEFQSGPPCPDCGSSATTLYPVDEDGGLTLYCDDCKREEIFNEKGDQ